MTKKLSKCCMDPPLRTRSITYNGVDLVTVVWMELEMSATLKSEVMSLADYANSTKFQGIKHMTFMGQQKPVVRIEEIPRYRITVEV